MDWKNARGNLEIKTEKFRDFGHIDKISKNTRFELLKTNQYTCRYCGGIYKKYLICTFISDIKSNDLCCRACYLITHLNYGIYRELKLYHSKMDQLKIVKDTIEFIIENDRIPLPIEIDPNILQAPISLLEFINLINNYNKIPKELQDYKIFFSQKFDINFIICNYGNNMITFIDDIDANNFTETEKMKLKKFKPSKEELDFYKENFNQKSPDG